jgi:hypothetical protein
MAPAADPAKPADVVLQDTALNGAQVTALVAILVQVSEGTLDHDGAVALITSSFPTFDTASAGKIVDGVQAKPPAPAKQPPQVFSPVMPAADPEASVSDGEESDPDSESVPAK